MNESIEMIHFYDDRLSDPMEIGHVISESLVIGDDSRIKTFIDQEQRQNTRIGSYVKIPVSDGDLFGVIASFSYEQQSPVNEKDQIPGREQEFTETDYALVAHIEPIAIVEEGRRSVDQIPKPLSTLESVEDQSLMYEGLNIARSGIPIGHVSVSGRTVPPEDPLVYHLPNDDQSALFRHLLIAGTTGKGKTHMAKNIIKQIVDGTGRFEMETIDGDLRREEICTVIIDPENEYSGLGRDPNIDVSDYFIDGFETGGIDDLSVFIPSAQNISSPSVETDTTRSFGIPFEIVRDRIGIMTIDSSGQTEDAIDRVLRDYFRKNEDVTYDHMLQFVESNRHQFVDQGPIHRGSWDAMIRRIEKPQFTDIFDRGDQSLLDLTDQIFRPGQVSVIPTDHIRGRQEYLLVMFLISYIVDNKIDTKDPDLNVKNTPLLLVVDEAHNYLSGADSAEQQQIVDQFTEAARQGRKDRFGLLNITQNPEDIADPIIKQTNTRIYLGLEAEVADRVSIPGNYDVTNFDRGQAVIKSPGAHPTEIVGLEDCLVDH